MNLFIACMAVALGGTRTWPAADEIQSGGGRMALVISNATYDHAESLPLARPDANRMVEALRTSGFEVVQHWELDQAGLKRAVADFKLQVQAKKPEATLMYYAGHGAEVSGRNFLIPVDARPASPDHMEADTTPLDWVLARLQEAGAPLNVVIVDACRNNPFRPYWTSSERSLSRDGLAPLVTAPSGFVVAYPTGPGKVAQDGIYAGPLANAMMRDCVRLEEVFKQTHAAVRRASEGQPEQQVPWTLMALGPGEFYFNRRGCTDSFDVSAAWTQVLSTPEPGFTVAIGEFLAAYSSSGGPEVAEAVRLARRPSGPAASLLAVPRDDDKKSNGVPAQVAFSGTPLQTPKLAGRATRRWVGVGLTTAGTASLVTGQIWRAQALAIAGRGSELVRGDQSTATAVNLATYGGLCLIAGGGALVMSAGFGTHQTRVEVAWRW